MAKRNANVQAVLAAFGRGRTLTQDEIVARCAPMDRYTVITSVQSLIGRRVLVAVGWREIAGKRRRLYARSKEAVPKRAKRRPRMASVLAQAEARLAAAQTPMRKGGFDCSALWQLFGARGKCVQGRAG